MVIKIKIVPIRPRDIEICVFLQKWRYATAGQLAKQFNLSKAGMSANLRKLCKGRYIKHELILHNYPGVYRCLTQGRELADTGLAPVHKVNERTMKHTLAIVEVAIHLENEGAELISEQEMRARKLYRDFVAKRKKRVHRPDIIAHFPENNTIAVEVELSRKNQNELHKILKWYADQPQYSEIRYYVPTAAAIARIERHAAGFNGVKVFLLP
ncbi:MAG TPA: hypothetical protein DIW17_12600 [Clostridiales bacterium]|nr:hypothetical protein [Clostridiales bacterium]